MKTLIYALAALGLMTGTTVNLLAADKKCGCTKCECKKCPDDCAPKK